MALLDDAIWKLDSAGPSASDELWAYCRADTLLSLFEQEYMDRIRRIDQIERRRRHKAFQEGWVGGDAYVLENAKP